MNNSKLLSGRAPVTPYSDLPNDRYQFLGLGQAEPSLGAGANNSVLTISTSNTRVWSNTLNLSSLTVTGESNLGNISNVHIFGGSSGQFVQTDGNGNLIFTDAAVDSAAPMPYYIPVGETYYVPENFQGIFTVPIQIDGTFEVDGILAEVGTAINSLNSQVIFDDNGELTGNVGFTFDQVTGNLSIPGAGIFTGALIPAANITYDLGSSTQRWKDLYLSNNSIFIGTSSISTDGPNLIFRNGDGGELQIVGNSISTTYSLSNGASTLTVNPTTVTFDIDGTANVLIVAEYGINIDGTVSATGNAAVSGILTDNYYYANGQPLDVGGNPGGSNTYVQFNNDGEFGGSANLTFNSTTSLLTLNGNIAASNANLGNLVTANYLVASGGCVQIEGATIAVSGNNAGIFASLIDDINFGLASNIIMSGSTNNVTVRGNLIANNNVTVTGNVSGNLLTGTLTTNAQPNITSVGTLTSLTVSGNTSSANLTVSNTIDAVNIKVTDLYSKRPAIPINTHTPIDTFPVAQFRSAKYTMRAGNGADYQALEVLLVHNDINSIITVYGSLSTSGSDLVVFDTDISAGNVNVYATAVGANTNLNLMGTYVPD